MYSGCVECARARNGAAALAARRSSPNRHAFGSARARAPALAVRHDARPPRARAVRARRRASAAASRCSCRCRSSRRSRTAPSASIWPKRSSTASTPKSGEHDDHTAPTLAVASIAITASGRFAMNAATRSPWPTPSARNPRGDARDLRAQLVPGRARVRSPRSLPNTIAVPLGVVLAASSRRSSASRREPVRAGHALGVLERGTCAAFAGDVGECP